MNLPLGFFAAASHNSRGCSPASPLSREQYSPTIVTQLTFSQGKFVIEHPEQADDRYLESLAGVEGVLRTYQNMKRARPKIKIEGLEAEISHQD